MLKKRLLFLCAAGCGSRTATIAFAIPSSVGQLPVPTALNARDPTLLMIFYHIMSQNAIALNKIFLVLTNFLLTFSALLTKNNDFDIINCLYLNIF